MIHILQGNINRNKTANDLLQQIVREMDIYLLLISEQYRMREDPSWYSDTLGAAAIWIPGKSMTQTKNDGIGKGFVWMRLDGIVFMSCHLTPNETTCEFMQKLDELEDAIRDLDGEMIVAGDFIARAAEWGMPDPNRRGYSLWRRQRD